MSTQFKTYSPDVLAVAEMITELMNTVLQRAQAAAIQNASPPVSQKVDKVEAAKIIGCKPRTIYEYVAQGKLKKIPTGPKGGKNMFLRADVEKLANNR